MLEIIRQLDQNRKDLLNSCFVDDAVIGLLIHGRSLITRPEEYLSFFFHHQYPLFERASPPFPILVARTTDLLSLEPTVAFLAQHTLYLPSALAIISIFYRSILKGSDMAELKEFELIQRIILTDQSVDNVQYFAGVLREARPFCDVSTLLQKYVLSPDYRFIAMMLVIAAFLRDWSHSERKVDVNSLVVGSFSLPKKARRAAILKFADGNLNQAFALALAETDDEAILDAVVSGLDS
jgi:hypothetical protein